MRVALFIPFGTDRLSMMAGLGLLLTLAGCLEKPSRPVPGGLPKVGVITLQPHPVTFVTELPGRTSAIAISEVRPQVTGVILKRLFAEGSDVKEGEQLYQIDPRPYQDTLDQALAQQARDTVQLTDAQRDLWRYQQLVVNQLAATRKQVDNQNAAVNSLIASIAADRATVKMAQVNLEYTEVLAPIAGRIGHSSVTSGALVTANQTAALATVTQLDPIYVDLNQPVTTLLRIRNELAAGEIDRTDNGLAKVTLKLDDGSTYPLSGRLDFSEVNVDKSTGTVLMRVTFPNPERLLLPGMYVHAAIEEGVEKGILVPQQALSRTPRGDGVVLVVGEGNKAEQRIVTTGPALGDQWVVTGGLKPGEQVIVDGLQQVRPGMTVQPVAANISVAATRHS
jgi:membrane fusion protein, multidrug efflux system